MNSELIRRAIKLDIPVGKLPHTQPRVCNDCSFYSENIPQYESNKPPFCGIGAPPLIFKGLCPGHTPIKNRT